MELGLKGKNVLVTGAAKGIGREIAFAAADEGANIALHFLGSKQEAFETAEEIKNEAKVKVCLVQGDIAVLGDVMKMKDELESQLGTIDYIVNNAGYAQNKSFFNYEPNEWKREVDVCFHGVVNLAYSFLSGMKERKKGKFINVVGDSARTGDRHLIISGAARNGAISFIKSLAKETGKDNIQCNTVSLGLIDQGDLPFNEQVMEKIKKQYPLRRLGKASDVTGAILFLLSGQADWITGQVLSVNGGHSMLG